jgi:hypothetical protein
MAAFIHKGQKNFCFVEAEVGGEEEQQLNTSWKENVMILLALKDQKLDSHQRGETVQNQLMDRLLNKRFHAFKDSLSKDLLDS